MTVGIECYDYCSRIVYSQLRRRRVAIVYDKLIVACYTRFDRSHGCPRCKSNGRSAADEGAVGKGL